MFASIYILLLMTSSIMTIDGRWIRNSDQIMPFILSPIIDEDGNLASSLLNNQNRLLFIIEHIMKYVSTIRSSEYFIDDIINRQKNVSDKLKILKFLNNCFRITDTLIQLEINRLLDMPNANEKSLFSLSFSLEELEQAHDKITNLHQVIEERIDTLKTWIPPTMPFLNF